MLWDYLLLLHNLLIIIYFTDKTIISEHEKRCVCDMLIPIQFKYICIIHTGSPGSSVVKNPPAKQETQVQSLDQENPLEKEMATHASILA